MAEPASEPGRSTLVGRGAVRVGLASLLLVAVIVVASVWIFRQFARAEIGRIQEDIEAVADAKRVAITALIRERMGDATFLTRLGAIWQAESQCGLTRPGLMEERLRNVLANAAQIYSFAYGHIWLLDPSLTPLNPAASRELTDTERESLQRALKTRSTTFVDLHFNADGEADFGVAQPVATGCDGDTLLGVVYFEVEAADVLYPLLTSFPSRYRSAEAVLLRQEGNDAVYLTPRRRAGPDRQPGMRRSMADPSVITVQALRYRVGASSDARTYEGERVVAAYVPIDGTPWVLLTRVDYEEAYASIRAFGLRVAAMAGGLVLIILCGTVVTVRLMTSQAAAANALLLRRTEVLRRANIDGFVAVDRTGRILDANAQLERMTGYALEELRGKPMGEIDPDPAIAARLLALPDEGRYAEVRFTSMWRTRDGGVLHTDNAVIYEPGDGDGVFYAFIRDMTQAVADRKRIEQLNRFYAFLSRVNTVVFRAKSTRELYDEVCRRAVQDGGFMASWIGVVDAQAGRVVPVTMHGSLDEYVRSLEITLDPSLPTSQGPSGTSVNQKRTVYIDDFQRDPRSAHWHTRALKYGIRSSASVPILVDDTVVASLTFYSDQLNHFDAEMRALLEETARNISRGVQALESQTAREASERRFAQVFEASPVPIHIFDLRAGRHLAMNRAHQRTFGYTLDDVPTEAAWFSAVYVDPLFREQIRAAWDGDLIRASLPDGPPVVASPDLQLRCRDGSTKTMRGYTAVVGDEVVTQWHDLTDVTQAMSVLRESEQRFRNLMERVPVVVYATQEGRLVYVNPALCRLIGLPAEQMLGRDAFEVLNIEAFWQERVQQARARLAAGSPQVNLVCPIHRADGSLRMLSNHATTIPWEGRPAALIIGEDITERHRNEERMAEYVRQLEGTMEGALEAVSGVVQLYDPITVGHERRVGVIACDIAREMGWPDERVRTVRLASLVHDIGRVALPMDVVSRPGPLTDAEYELVKTHSQKGYDILRHISFPMPIAEIVLQHHERMDGSGYPRGLKGDAILPEARVVMVADVVESMANDRPHRKAPGFRAALQELESHRGTAYDAEVVDALLRLVNQKQYVLPPPNVA